MRSARVAGCLAFGLAIGSLVGEEFPGRDRQRLGPCEALLAGTSSIALSSAGVKGV